MPVGDDGGKEGADFAQVIGPSDIGSGGKTTKNKSRKKTGSGGMTTKKT